MDNESKQLAEVVGKPMAGKPHRVDLKTPLTLQEIGFLENYFISPYSPMTAELSQDEAMLAAGYGNYQAAWRGRIAKKILQKYEQQAGNVREIFCDIGLGQAQIARGIKHKAENALSEKVSLNALKLAATCTNMIPRDNAPIGPIGIQVVFNCSKEQASPEKTSITFGLAPIKD